MSEVSDERGLLVTFTPSQRCDHDALNIEDCHKTWGMGWCCILCGRPVAIRIEHYGSAVPTSDIGSSAPEATS